MAQLAIVSTNAAEGKDVHLRIRNKPPNDVDIVWYRGEGTRKNRVIAFLSKELRKHIKGPAHTGRERIYDDGSMLLKRVSMKDAGMYTVVIYLQDYKKEIGFGRLNVYDPLLKARVVASNTTVTENKDAVVLTCYTNAVSVQWLFNGMNLRLREHMKLSKDHRRLTINPVKREDAGNYQCEVSNPIRSMESWPLTLDVKSE
ncbi:carcinoembryonic antigen-related cell adhesion molecule 21-like [Pteronotus mesoamericanus]|uniref:carcinoembryonic antigen-related cell adhesion molecule 21-like n=1 Tax=Pteronotus mesoamericanus TaxID=1884717 RepID=UPI0023EDADC7|nr:carcinoembryonic antigen-related cell adhesion molecule 21-like [Pteronotus parnellii mesoamericanus]